MWTRSCCASLPGLRNRFSQCPQTCTVAPDAGVEPTPLNCTSDALPEAAASVGPSSSCCATGWATGRRGRHPLALLGPAAAALPGPLFARGSEPVPLARPAIACACAASVATCPRLPSWCVARREKAATIRKLSASHAFLCIFVANGMSALPELHKASPALRHRPSSRPHMCWCYGRCPRSAGLFMNSYFFLLTTEEKGWG